MQIFIAIRESVHRLRFLCLVRDTVFQPLSKDLSHNLDAYLKSKIGSTGLYLNDFIRILQKFVRKLVTEEEKSNMQKMLLLLIDDADMMIHTIDQVQQYCKTGGAVQSNDIYQVDIGALK